MKRVLLSSFFVVTAFVTVSAQIEKTPVVTKTKTAVIAPAPIFKNLLDSFSYAAGINIATNMKAQGINKLNSKMLQKAIDDVFNNKTPLMNVEASNACIQKQIAIFTAEQAAELNAKGINYLAANKLRKEVITLPNGLQYEVIKTGDAKGNSPKAIDTAIVNYVGTLIDGVEFDNSFKRGAPAAFAVNGVIQGWTQILQMMKAGDHWKVYIPSDLAYGAGGAPGTIPPNSVLVFEIVLEGIIPAKIVEEIKVPETTPKN